MLSNSPIVVTNQDLDESIDSDYELVDHEVEDSNSSEKGQKMTAVIAIIDTVTKDLPLDKNTPRGVVAVANHSSQKRSEYYWTLVLMEIFGSTEK